MKFILATILFLLISCDASTPESSKRVDGMILLYKDLAQKDAKRLVEELNRRNIQYELENSPSIRLYVPRDQKDILWRNLPKWADKTKEGK